VGTDLPWVSAILTVHDRTAYLGAALRSVRAQDYAGKIEIVVVDDGSDVPVEPAFRDEFPEVRWVRQENRGVCAARQAGCDHARGDVLAFLDDDDAWHPTKTSLQVRLLAARPELAGVGSDLTPIEHLAEGGTRLFREREIVSATSEGTVPGVGDAFVLDPARLREFTFRQLPLFPSSLLVPRRSLARMGGWNPSIRGPGDCHDFLIRLTHGCALGYVDRPLLGLRRGHVDHMTRDGLDVTFQEARTLARVYAGYPAALRQAVRAPLARWMERGEHRLRTHGRPGEAAEVLDALIRLDGSTWRRWAKRVLGRARRFGRSPRPPRPSVGNAPPGGAAP
jgi:glycosyltransferase involved in cell wall biosynthesis